MRSRDLPPAAPTTDAMTEADLVAYVAATQVHPPSGLVDQVMAALAASPMPRRASIWPWAAVRTSWSSLPRLHAAAALIVLAMACTAGVTLAVASATQPWRDDSPAIVSPPDAPEPSGPAAAATSTAEPSDEPDPAAADPLPIQPTARPSHTAKPAAATARPPREDGDDHHDGGTGASDSDGHDGDSSDAEDDGAGPTDSPDPTAHPTDTDEPSDPE